MTADLHAYADVRRQVLWMLDYLDTLYGHGSGDQPETGSR